MAAAESIRTTVMTYLHCYTCQSLVPSIIVEPHVIACEIRRYHCDAFILNYTGHIQKVWWLTVYSQAPDLHNRCNNELFLFGITKKKGNVYEISQDVGGLVFAVYDDIDSLFSFIRIALREYGLYP